MSAEREVIAVLLPVASRLFSSSTHFCAAISERIAALAAEPVQIVLGLDDTDPAEQVLRSTITAVLGCNTDRISIVKFQRKKAEEAVLDWRHAVDLDSQLAQSGMSDQKCGTTCTQTSHLGSTVTCAPYTPICWYWEQLAQHACNHLQAQGFVLLGDDCSAKPHQWTKTVTGALHTCTQLHETRILQLLQC